MTGRRLVKRVWGAGRHISIWCLSATWLLAVDPADTLIKKVETRYNSAQTLTVRFTEQYSVLGHKRPPESGLLTLRKQGKMRWDYTHPAGKLFLTDGKTVYLYTAADNRVEKIPMKETDDMRAPLGFLLGKLDLRRQFRGFSVRTDGGGEWLHAEAKSERAPYSSLDMLVAETGVIRELTVQGRDQSLLSFTFEGESVNPPVADGLFHFSIPPGAEVVNAIEYQGEAH